MRKETRIEDDVTRESRANDRDGKPAFETMQRKSQVLHLLPHILLAVRESDD